MNAEVFEMLKVKDDQVVLYLRAVHKAVAAWAREFRYQPELAKSHYWTLFSKVFLAEYRNRPLRERDAYQAINMSPSTGARVIRKAVDEGYLTVQPYDPESKNPVYVVRLTDKGKVVLKKSCSGGLKELEMDV